TLWQPAPATRCSSAATRRGHPPLSPGLRMAILCSQALQKNSANSPGSAPKHRRWLSRSLRDQPRSDAPIRNAGVNETLNRPHLTMPEKYHRLAALMRRTVERRKRDKRNTNLHTSRASKLVL